MFQEFSHAAIFWTLFFWRGLALPGNLKNSYILGLANGQGVGEQSPSKPRCVACGKTMLTEPLFQGERQAKQCLMNFWCWIYHVKDTPWKINMEPTNHPFRKEIDLPNLHDYVPC